MSKIRLQNIFDISQLTRNLYVFLNNLTFGDNFNSFSVEATIPANSEQSFRNPLNLKPNSYIIRFQTGNALITASTTEWTDDFVYFTNHDASNAATVKIIIWRE